MKNLIFHCALLIFPLLTLAQNKDTINHLNEIIIIGKGKTLSQRQPKPLAKTEDYLQQSDRVNMIRRGAYAWEPVLNSLASERSLITIEGMHIFGACTDKMDPVTSYIEISNLSEASLTSGQHGATYGPTIAGAIDLKRKTTGFAIPGWKTMINTGFETNNRQKITGASLSYSGEKWYWNTDLMYRNAGNYKAGNGQEIGFSRFRKFNISGIAGIRLDSTKLLEATTIFDDAQDVGYPALPMDVSLARAVISSVKLAVSPANRRISQWDTKLYYNTVTHRMDDSQRPDVILRMDMPGWSTTYGGYSAIKGLHRKHFFNLTLNSYYNKAVADMTMYPANPGGKSMYMYTWPDVRTFYSGVTAQDRYEFNCHSSLKFSGSLGYHRNTLASTMGLESLQIFYPTLLKSNDRLLKSVALSCSYGRKTELSVGASYGERAPSVSEGYGFYLFNSADNYDYIGNPFLGNEKALEGNMAVTHRTSKGHFTLTGTCFRILDYIIGKPDPASHAMTIGATGVKKYTALPYATIFSGTLKAGQSITSQLKGTAQLVYTLGKDHSGAPLPLISPLRYNASLAYKKRAFSANLQLDGNAARTNFAAEYGESKTPSYAIVSLNTGYRFAIAASTITANAGVENLLDTYYTTFSDWNSIPRQGRNFFLNLIYSY